MSGEKSYSFFKLMQIADFDALKTSKRFKRKELYFEALFAFTSETPRIIESSTPHRYLKEARDFNALAFDIDLLQTMLANIGAVHLTWELQDLNQFLEKKAYQQYFGGLTCVFPHLTSLVAKIVDAELHDAHSQGQGKTEFKTPKPVPMTMPVATDPPPMQPVQRAEETLIDARPIGNVVSEPFERLQMLVDNFEFSSASHSISSLQKFTYTAEINQLLTTLKGHLEKFDHDQAMNSCKHLMATVEAARVTSSLPALKRILAVDDMADVLRTVKAMLKGKYTVFGMTEWNSALSFLNSNSADLIILDIEMPGLDGFSLLQLIRKLPDYVTVPVVFLTSNTNPENIKKALSMGANDFVKKPVDVHTLTSKLDTIFESVAEAKRKQ